MNGNGNEPQEGLQLIRRAKGEMSKRSPDYMPESIRNCISLPCIRYVTVRTPKML